MILTTNQVAEQLHVNRRLVDALRRYGLLHAVHLGRGYGYRLSELDRFLEWAEDKDLGTMDQIRYWGRKKGSDH